MGVARPRPSCQSWERPRNTSTHQPHTAQTNLRLCFQFTPPAVVLLPCHVTPRAGPAHVTTLTSPPAPGCPSLWSLFTLLWLPAPGCPPVWTESPLSSGVTACSGHWSWARGEPGSCEGVGESLRNSVKEFGHPWAPSLCQGTGH